MKEFTDQFIPSPQPVTATNAATAAPASPIPPLNPTSSANQPTLKDLDDKVTGAKRIYTNVVREAQRMFKEIEESMAPKKHLLDKFNEEFKYLKSILDQNVQKAGITETGAATSQNQQTAQQTPALQDTAQASVQPTKEGEDTGNHDSSVQWKHRDSEEMELRQRLASMRRSLKSLTGSRRSRKRRERSRIRSKLRALMAHRS